MVEKYKWLAFSIYSVVALLVYLFIVPMEGFDKTPGNCVVATIICSVLAIGFFWKHREVNGGYNG